MSLLCPLDYELHGARERQQCFSALSAGHHKLYAPRKSLAGRAISFPSNNFNN